MSTDRLRETVSRLAASADALAALGAALDTRQGVRSDPEIQRHLDEVVDALGVTQALNEASPTELSSTLGQIRAFFLGNVKLLSAATRRRGWAHPEQEILDAAGDVSASFPHALQRALAPQMPGVTERLEAPGAAFLDVGVGVGVLSIEMARLWPNLRVVGIDPWAPSIRLARERVGAAGLLDRIELREQAGEDLRDESAFDLAWIPSAFVPHVAIRALLPRVHRALRPGGWLLFPVMRLDPDPLGAALVRLRVCMFGGFVATTAEVEKLLREARFTDVRALPAPPGALAVMVIGRR